MLPFNEIHLKFLREMVQKIIAIDKQCRLLEPDHFKSTFLQEHVYCKEGVCELYNEKNGCDHAKAVKAGCPIQKYLDVAVNLGFRFEGIGKSMCSACKKITSVDIQRKKKQEIFVCKKCRTPIDVSALIS